MCTAHPSVLWQNRSQLLLKMASTAREPDDGKVLSLGAYNIRVLSDDCCSRQNRKQNGDTTAASAAWSGNILATRLRAIIFLSTGQTAKRDDRINAWQSSQNVAVRTRTQGDSRVTAEIKTKQISTKESGHVE